jgi:hypothetical protein
MSETEWKDEREKLLERLQKAEQIAAESQAEAAVYWDMLENWYEAATQAQAQQDFSLLQKINKGLIPFHLPSKQEGKSWGQLFLKAYKRDDRRLGRAKQALERIRDDAENLSVEGNESNMKLKKSIIETAKEGLI